MSKYTKGVNLCPKYNLMVGTTVTTLSLASPRPHPLVATTSS